MRTMAIMDRLGEGDASVAEDLCVGLGGAEKGEGVLQGV